MWLAETTQIELAIARNEPTLQKELPRADGPAHLASGIAQSADLLRLYLRYGSQLHRQYLRCLKELRDLQSSRPPTNPDHKRSSNREGGEIHNPEAATPNEATEPPIAPQPNDAKRPDQPTEASAPNKANESVSSPTKTAEPNKANTLTPEQAQVIAMKAEIIRRMRFQP